MATAEETGRKVQRILVAEFNDVRLTKDGGFAVQHGSSITFVEPTDWAPDSEGNPRSLVRVWAPLGRDVTPTPELFKWAATEGQGKWFGSVTVVEGKDGEGCFVMFDHTLLGDYVDPAELIYRRQRDAVHRRRPRRHRARPVRRQAVHRPGLMAIRDQVRDEAIAAAKAYAHAEVELRHVLWGLVVVLVPMRLPPSRRPRARRLLEPRGSATAAPTVSAEADKELAAVATKDTAIALCSELGHRLITPTPTGGPLAVQVSGATRVGGPGGHADRRGRGDHPGGVSSLRSSRNWTRWWACARPRHRSAA